MSYGLQGQEWQKPISVAVLSNRVSVLDKNIFKLQT